ncbi:MAG: DUF4288 domain-containing protein [Pseudohongiellaceae bacterium]
MNYSVCLLFFSDFQDGSTPLWEERIVLFGADSEVEVRKKAEDYGRSEEHCYESEGRKLNWKFECVERIYQIDGDLVDEIELFSRFLRDSEVKSLLSRFDETDSITPNKQEGDTDNLAKEEKRTPTT